MESQLSISYFIVQWHSTFDHWVCLIERYFGLWQRLCSRCQIVGKKDFITTSNPSSGKQLHCAYCGQFGKIETIELLVVLSSLIYLAIYMLEEIAYIGWKKQPSNLFFIFIPFTALPVGVAKRLEKLQKDFLWGGMSEEFKFHLVSWKVFCTLICSEGLGIKDQLLFIFYSSFVQITIMAICGRRENVLQKRVIDLKYSPNWGS